jgi:hypothetical protein
VSHANPGFSGQPRRVVVLHECGVDAEGVRRVLRSDSRTDDSVRRAILTRSINRSSLHSWSTQLDPAHHFGRETCDPIHPLRSPIFVASYQRDTDPRHLLSWGPFHSHSSSSGARLEPSWWTFVSIQSRASPCRCPILTTSKLSVP